MLVRKHSSYFDHLDSRPVQVVHIPSIPQGRDCLLTSLFQTQLSLDSPGNPACALLPLVIGLGIVNIETGEELSAEYASWLVSADSCWTRVCSLGALWLAARNTTADADYELVEGSLDLGKLSQSHLCVDS